MKYTIIGGQYYFKKYGYSDTLRGAKRIAARHPEFWDNYQGWHIPAVYLSDDLDKNGYPEYGVRPVVFHNGKKWEKVEKADF